MQTLATISSQKPAWIANEGHWRILQLLRFVLVGGLALLGIGSLFGFIFDHMEYRYIIIAASFFGLALSAYWGLYAAAWALCWVRDGFSKTKESS